jgi:hypothetical protein
MEKKKCKQCGLEKEINEFYKRNNVKYKNGGYQHFCKICTKENVTNWYKENKGKEKTYKRLREYYLRKVKEFKALVNIIKSKIGCSICPEKEVYCLDFHHYNKNKDESISDIISRKNKEALIKEIRKCICVCSNCHRKIHAGTIVLNKNTIDENLERTNSAILEVFGTISENQISENKTA